MRLSEFLISNGNEELRKNCRITKPIWDDILNNQRVPSPRVCENIIKYLGGDSPTKQKIYRDALWRCILYDARPLSLLDLVVHIVPYAAPRPRFSRMGRVYNPKKYTKWKRDLSALVGEIGTISGPCAIVAEYHFKTPTGGTMGYHTNPKDIDNLDKALLDALQMNGLIEDDKFVYRMDSSKYYGYQDKITIKIHHNGLWTK